MSTPKLYSYDDLARITGKQKTALANLVLRLHVKKVIRRSKTYFEEEEANKVINYKPSDNKKITNHRRKITIIEEYMHRQTIKGVARTLSINVASVRAAVQEWEENDEYIVVDSKMNIISTSNYTCISQRGKKWMYEKKINGVKYVKCGFNTEEEAFYALTQLKESLKKELV